MNGVEITYGKHGPCKEEGEWQTVAMYLVWK